CLSGEVLLAKSLLSARQQDLADLIGQVRDGLTVPIVGVISDGQHSIRKAVARALPDVPHQLCHFHYLREAARPLYEADRHAKKELKKRVRGVRPLERSLEGRSDAEAEAARGYCDAVRSALTDDGRPPLEASGLRLHERLSAVAASLDAAAERTPAAEKAVAFGAGDHGGIVAAGRPDVRLGLARGIRSGRERPEQRGGGSPAVGRPVGGDGAAWRAA